MEPSSLDPHLDEAQKALADALEKACGVDVRKVGTDELIRIEETLASASEAAKQAVSVRLRMRSRREEDKRKLADLPVNPATDAEGVPAVTRRVFDDIRGKRWNVFAVRPTSGLAERTPLPESYQHGWLSFESSDEMRRIAPIPDKWAEMSTDELRSLCHGASSTPKRSGSAEAGAS